MNAIERSKCIFDLILADISKNYKSVGGGGISSIKQNSTTSFTVSISQEERIDLLTYEVTVSPDGKARIVSMKSDTQSPGR